MNKYTMTTRFPSGMVITRHLNSHNFDDAWDQARELAQLDNEGLPDDEQGAFTVISDATGVMSDEMPGKAVVVGGSN